MNDDDKWNMACIRITSKSIDPEQITNTLHLQPSSAHSRGELISRRKPEGQRRTENLWILDSGLDDSHPLGEHIERLVEIMESSLKQFKMLLPACEFDLWCGFSSGSGQGGLVLEAELLRRITVLPIDLVIDLYPPENHLDCIG